MKFKILTVLLLSIFITSCNHIKRKPEFKDNDIKVVNNIKDNEREKNDNVDLDFNNSNQPKEINEPSLVKTLLLSGGIFLISNLFHVKK